jgi:hypothetical protein
MTRHLSIILLFFLFGHTILASVIPNPHDFDDEALTKALDEEDVPQSLQESDDGFDFDDKWSGEGDSEALFTRAADAAGVANEAAPLNEERELSPEELRVFVASRDDSSQVDPESSSDTIAARTPVECRRLVSTSIDTCKRRVRNGVATCKKNIQDNIATCKDNVRRDIDNCKKGTRNPFTKSKCELQRPGRMRQCEQRRLKIPLCERASPQVAGCCEGIRAKYQATCAIPSFPISLVRTRLQSAQDLCMRGFNIL